jgi:hypothetical protein
MHKLQNWEAHRSGAAMTITGHSKLGQTKIAGVKKIERRESGTVAILNTGHEVELA